MNKIVLLLLFLLLSACSREALVSALQGVSSGLTQYSQRTAATNYSSPSTYKMPTTYQQIGNTVYSSDGTTYQQIGNAVYSSDGTVCRAIGNTVYCN
jgi:hypothetical protein